MDNFSNDSDLDEIIQQVKQEFKRFLVKRRELVLRLGNAFERVVANPESICEEIKNTLQDEIADKVISARNIEMYCPSSWKRKTKPKNENSSFSTNKEEERENKLIAIDTQGSTVYERKLIAGTRQAYIGENNFDLQHQEKPTNIQNNATEMHNCPNCEQLLIENQKIQSEKDIKIKQLEDEIRQYYNELEIKISENADMQIQLDRLKEQLQLKDENNSSMSSSSSSKDYHQLESNAIVDIEFSLKYEDVHKYVSSILKVSGALGPLWFNCRLDKRTCRVIAAYPGSIAERTKSDDIDKGYNRND